MQRASAGMMLTAPGLHLHAAHGRHHVVAGLAGDALGEQRDLRRTRERVAPQIHGHGAGVTGFAGERE